MRTIPEEVMTLTCPGALVWLGSDQLEQRSLKGDLLLGATTTAGKGLAPDPLHSTANGLWFTLFFVYIFPERHFR